jgi:hypothetical protein
MQTDTTIRNCAVKFRYQCPWEWEALEQTESETVRFCNTCNRNVYFCSTDEETISHAELGHCIAREVPSSDELPRVVVGEPARVERPTIKQLTAYKQFEVEHVISLALTNFKSHSPRCAECGYPLPAFIRKCRVCACRSRPIGE